MGTIQTWGAGRHTRRPGHPTSNHHPITPSQDLGAEDLAEYIKQGVRFRCALTVVAGSIVYIPPGWHVWRQNGGSGSNQDKDICCFEAHFAPKLPTAFDIQNMSRYANLMRRMPKLSQDTTIEVRVAMSIIKECEGWAAVGEAENGQSAEVAQAALPKDSSATPAQLPAEEMAPELMATTPKRKTPGGAAATASPPPQSPPPRSALRAASPEHGPPAHSPPRSPAGSLVAAAEAEPEQEDEAEAASTAAAPQGRGSDTTGPPRPGSPLEPEDGAEAAEGDSASQEEGDGDDDDREKDGDGDNDEADKADKEMGDDAPQQQEEQQQHDSSDEQPAPATPQAQGEGKARATAKSSAAKAKAKAQAKTKGSGRKAGKRPAPVAESNPLLASMHRSGRARTT